MKKIFKSKFGIGLLLFPTLAFILGLILFLLFKAPRMDDYIGAKQAAVLRTIGQGEQGLSFVDTSARLAAWQSTFDLGENGGFYSDTGDDSVRAAEEYPCDKYGYNLWNSKSTKCWPNVEQIKQAYELYFDKNLKTNFFSQYPDKSFNRVSYDYTIRMNYEQGSTSITGLTSDSVPITIVSQRQVVEKKILTSGIIPAKEPLTKCCDGSCAVNVAERYYNMYGVSSAIKLPYVWGGATPYPIQQTLKEQEDNGKDSFFYGTEIYTVQPAGNDKRSGQLTIPGFDCSGFVWWVYKHAELTDFSARTGAGAYETLAKQKGYAQICGFQSKACTSEIINNEAQPGDLIFKYNDQNTEVGHVAIYAGSSKIIDSSGDRDGIDKRALPESWLAHMTVYRFPYNTGCTGTETTPVAQASTPQAGQATTAQSTQTSQLRLGALSEKYESGSRGSEAIGYDTTGKTSYGKYQIASGTGTMKSFLSFLSAQDATLYNHLESSGNPNCEYACQPQGCYLSSDRATACTPSSCYVDCEFVRSWKEEVQKGSFNNNLEHDFIKKTHYDPTVNAIKSQCEGLDINQRSFALQNVVWSTAVQHGAYAAGNIFKRAGATPDKSDEQIIKAVYAERSKVNTYFSGSTTDVQKAVKNRFIDEEKTALAWLGSNVQGISEPAESSVEYFTPVDIGYYYVNPSFTTEVNYDLKAYEWLTAWSKLVYERCSGSQQILADCVDKEIKDQNEAFDNLMKQSSTVSSSSTLLGTPFLFSIKSNSYCDGLEEADFYQFIEIFENCYEFGNPGCYCDFDMLDLRSIKSIVLTNTSIILNRNDEIAYYYSFPESKVFNLYHNGELYDNFSISVSTVIGKEWYQITYTKGGQSTTEGRPKLYLAKNVKIGQDGRALITFEDQPTQYLIGGKSNSFPSSKCDLKNQQHKFRFCAATPQKIYSYDGSDLGLKEVPIKFALDLYDAPPPAITANAKEIDKPEEIKKEESENPLTPEKECEGIGKAEFNLKVTTADLKPAFDSFITNFAIKLVPQLGVLLFAKNFLVATESLPALVNVQVDLKGASKDCDITGLVYKCGVGVAPLINGKFDFSNPTGYIDISSRFNSAAGFSAAAPDACMLFKNPDGSFMDKSLRYTKPQISGDLVSFTVDKCVDPILQYKKMSGLDIITSALNGFGYYFAFAYVDAAGNYGDATVRMVEVPSILSQLEEQLGIKDWLMLKNIVLGDYDSIFSFFGLDDELSLIKRAIASASLDRLLVNLKGEALNAAYAEIAKNINNEEAKTIFNSVARDCRFDEDCAAQLAEKAVEELTSEEAQKLMDELDLEDFRQAYYKIESWPLEKKQELLIKAGEKEEEIRSMGEAQINKRIKTYMDTKETALRILKAINPDDLVTLAKDMIKEQPAKFIQQISDILPDDKIRTSIQDVLTNVSEAKSDAARAAAFYASGEANEAALNHIINNIPGFDKYKDLVSVFGDFSGTSCS